MKGSKTPTVIAVTALVVAALAATPIVGSPGSFQAFAVCASMQ